MGALVCLSEFSHYFTSSENMEHKEHKFSLTYAGNVFTFKTDSGVFSRSKLDDGSHILLDALSGIEMSGNALDLGCGWGAIGIIMKKLYPELTLSFADINPRAAQLTRENLRLNNQTAEVIVSDGASQIPGTFDWIVLNPPIRAGKQKVHEIIESAADKLTPDGKLALVVRKQQGAESLTRYLSGIFDNVERISRDKGYWVIISSNDTHCEPMIP
jgi:16S rRNA (guanine1207-N2)-methyltransferase